MFWETRTSERNRWEKVFLGNKTMTKNSDVRHMLLMAGSERLSFSLVPGGIAADVRRLRRLTVHHLVIQRSRAQVMDTGLQQWRIHNVWEVRVPDPRCS